jgi:RimJ/RimL family protein N-acetyltransferase
MWQLMLHVCFNELSLHRVSLTTASYNLIGQRVYKNLGFKEEGRQIESLYREEKYHDSICMYLLKQDWNNK